MPANTHQIDVIIAGLAEPLIKAFATAHVAMGTFKEEAERSTASVGRGADAAASKVDNLGKVVRRVAAGFAALVATAGFSKVTYDVLQAGSAMEDLELSIATVVSATNGITDALGNTLVGQDKLNAAMEVSASLIGQLNTDALMTTATTQELADGFQAVVGPAAAIGLNVAETEKLVVRTAQAMGALKIPLREMGQELRGVLAGEGGPSNRLNQVLRITKEQLEELKQEGKLFEGLMASMEDFGTAGEAAGRTWSGLTSSLRDVAEAVQRIASIEPLKKLEEAFGSLLDNAIKVENGVGRLNPELVKFGVQAGHVFGMIVEWTIIAAQKLYALGQWLAENRSWIIWTVGIGTAIVVMGKLAFAITHVMFVTMALNLVAVKVFGTTIFGAVTKLVQLIAGPLIIALKQVAAWLGVAGAGGVAAILPIVAAFAAVAAAAYGLYKLLEAIWEGEINTIGKVIASIAAIGVALFALNKVFLLVFQTSILGAVASVGRALKGLVTGFGAVGTAGIAAGAKAALGFAPIIAAATAAAAAIGGVIYMYRVLKEEQAWNEKSAETEAANKPTLRLNALQSAARTRELTANEKSEMARLKASFMKQRTEDRLSQGIIDIPNFDELMEKFKLSPNLGVDDGAGAAGAAGAQTSRLFEAQQDQLIASAKRHAEKELEILRTRYDDGLVSAKQYYDEKQRIEDQAHAQELQALVRLASAAAAGSSERISAEEKIADLIHKHEMGRLRNAKELQAALTEAERAAAKERIDITRHEVDMQRTMLDASYRAGKVSAADYFKTKEELARRLYDIERETLEGQMENLAGEKRAEKERELAALTRQFSKERLNITIEEVEYARAVREKAFAREISQMREQFELQRSLLERNFSLNKISMREYYEDRKKLEEDQYERERELLEIKLALTGDGTADEQEALAEIEELDRQHYRRREEHARNFFDSQKSIISDFFRVFLQPTWSDAHRLAEIGKLFGGAFIDTFNSTLTSSAGEALMDFGEALAAGTREVGNTVGAAIGDVLKPALNDMLGDVKAFAMGASTVIGGLAKAVINFVAALAPVLAVLAVIGAIIAGVLLFADHVKNAGLAITNAFDEAKDAVDSTVASTERAIDSMRQLQEQGMMTAAQVADETVKAWRKVRDEMQQKLVAPPTKEELDHAAELGVNPHEDPEKALARWRAKMLPAFRDSWQGFFWGGVEDDAIPDNVLAEWGAMGGMNADDLERFKHFAQQAAKRKAAQSGLEHAQTMLDDATVRDLEAQIEQAQELFSQGFIDENEVQRRTASAYKALKDHWLHVWEATNDPDVKAKAKAEYEKAARELLEIENKLADQFNARAQLVVGWEFGATSETGEQISFAQKRIEDIAALKKRKDEEDQQRAERRASLLDQHFQQEEANVKRLARLREDLAKNIIDEEAEITRILEEGVLVKQLSVEQEKRNRIDEVREKAAAQRETIQEEINNLEKVNSERKTSFEQQLARLDAEEAKSNENYQRQLTRINNEYNTRERIHQHKLNIIDAEILRLNDVLQKEKDILDAIQAQAEARARTAAGVSGGGGGGGGSTGGSSSVLHADFGSYTADAIPLLQEMGWLPMATGGIIPGTGNKDNFPALLMPGELVVPKGVVKKLLTGDAIGGNDMSVHLTMHVGTMYGTRDMADQVADHVVRKISRHQRFLGNHANA